MCMGMHVHCIYNDTVSKLWCNIYVGGCIMSVKLAVTVYIACMAYVF